MAVQASRPPAARPGRHGRAIRAVVVVLMIIATVVGCGLLSPHGTVKVDGDEYGKAVKETRTLVRAANDLIDQAYGGKEVLVGRVRSDPCGEPYADNLRQLGVNTSVYYTGAVTEAQVIGSIQDGLEADGWTKRKAENGRYFFEHGLTGGATLNLYVDARPAYEQEGRMELGLYVESTCMRIPKDIAEKT